MSSNDDYARHQSRAVTQVDDDGNELSGIRLPNMSVPLATYTGWSFRNPSIGQPDELLPLTGSFTPSRSQKKIARKRLIHGLYSIASRATRNLTIASPKNLSSAMRDEV
jgi:hypothetical protein